MQRLNVMLHINALMLHIKAFFNATNKDLEQSSNCYFLFFTRCDVICDPLQYTHTRKKCNLFVLYNKNSNGLLGYEKKKNKSADVDLTPSVCAL